jgi:hypothetical protein
LAGILRASLHLVSLSQNKKFIHWTSKLFIEDLRPIHDCITISDRGRPLMFLVKTKVCVSHAGTA